MRRKGLATLFLSSDDDDGHAEEDGQDDDFFGQDDGYGWFGQMMCWSARMMTG